MRHHPGGCARGSRSRHQRVPRYGGRLRAQPGGRPRARRRVVRGARAAVHQRGAQSGVRGRPCQARTRGVGPLSRVRRPERVECAARGRTTGAARRRTPCGRPLRVRRAGVGAPTRAPRRLSPRDSAGPPGSGGGEYEWTTQVDQALGTVTAQDIDRVIGAMLRTAATTPGADLLAGSRLAFPHAAATLGRLYAVDSVTTTPHGDSTATVVIAISLHPDRLRATYPAYAAYIHKYVDPSHMRLALADAGGTEWFDVTLDDDQLVATLRATADGHFAPRTGPARPMPDSLNLHIGFPREGLDLLGRLQRSGRRLRDGADAQRSEWRLRFRKEPHWHLPLFDRPSASNHRCAAPSPATA